MSVFFVSEQRYADVVADVMRRFSSGCGVSAEEQVQAVAAYRAADPPYRPGDLPPVEDFSGGGDDGGYVFDDSGEDRASELLEDAFDYARSDESGWFYADEAED